MRFLLALAAMSTAVLITSPVATPSPAPTKVERRAVLEAAVILEMNRVRVARGLRPLHSAPALRSSARGHSQAMLDHGFFSHQSADGTAFNVRIRRYYTDRGFAKWSVGEALMASQGAVDASAIVEAWLQSPPHRTIVLSPAWRDTGIGVLYATSAPQTFGGNEAVVVTADFGLREGRAGTP